MKAKLDEIDEEFPIREEAVDTLINKSRQVDDNKSLQKITADFDNERGNVEKLLKNANDFKAAVDKIQQQMNDCEIPSTITNRHEQLLIFDKDLD